MAEPRYWFPAKRYGCGWAFPATWHDWVVFTAYLFFILSTVCLIPVGFFSAVGVAKINVPVIC